MTVVIGAADTLEGGEKMTLAAATTLLLTTAFVHRAPPLPTPSAVRVHLVDGPVLTCRLVDEDEEALSLMGCAGAPLAGTTRVPLKSIDRLERSAGIRRGHAATVGFLVGAAIGAGAVLLQGDIEELCSGANCLPVAGFVGLLTGGAGAGLGALNAPNQWVEDVAATTALPGSPR